MNIRTKFWLGLGFLMVITAGVVVLSLLSVRRLTESGTQVIRDNYRSLEYMQAIDSLVDVRWTAAQTDVEPCTGYPDWRHRLDSLVLLQQQNVTETGEREATQGLSAAVKELPECHTGKATLLPALETLHAQTDYVIRLNLKAIRNKAEAAEGRGAKAMQEAVMVATAVFLLVLMFAASFPRTIILPLSELTRMAQRLAGGAYGEQVPIDNDQDEIGQLALAFNEMSTELARYQRSSLARLMEAQQRTEHIINRLHSPLIVADADWRILFFNNLARQILGAQSSPLIGSNLLELAIRNDLLRRWLAPVAEGNPPPAQSISVVLRNRAQYFLPEAFPISGGIEGEPLGYALAMTDVTRFRELDQAKTDFLATVAHELKTPLSTINISLNILQSSRAGQVSADQMELMATMSAELARLMTLINGLLDMTRIESESTSGEIISQSINLASLLQEVVHRFQVQAEEKQVRIQIHAPIETLALALDANTLALAVGNLVSNAVRFSPKGATVLVDAAVSEGRLLITVEDEGPGIPIDDRDRVFDKYFHASADGTGLGLFIARGIAEKVGGSLRYEARADSGSQFRLSIPIVE